MVAFVKDHNQSKFYRPNVNLIRKKGLAFSEPNQSLEIWREKLNTHSTKYHVDFQWRDAFLEPWIETPPPPPSYRFYFTKIEKL